MAIDPEVGQRTIFFAARKYEDATFRAWLRIRLPYWTWHVHTSRGGICEKYLSLDRMDTKFGTGTRPKFYVNVMLSLQALISVLLSTRSGSQA